MSNSDKAPVSPDMNKTKAQAKAALESMTLQITRDLQKMNQRELTL